MQLQKPKLLSALKSLSNRKKELEMAQLLRRWRAVRRMSSNSRRRTGDKLLNRFVYVKSKKLSRIQSIGQIYPERSKRRFIPNTKSWCLHRVIEILQTLLVIAK